MQMLRRRQAIADAALGCDLHAKRNVAMGHGRNSVEHVVIVANWRHDNGATQRETLARAAEGRNRRARRRTECEQVHLFCDQV